MGHANAYLQPIRRMVWPMSVSKCNYRIKVTCIRNLSTISNAIIWRIRSMLRTKNKVIGHGASGVVYECVVSSIVFRGFPPCFAPFWPKSGVASFPPCFAPSGNKGEPAKYHWPVAYRLCKEQIHLSTSVPFKYNSRHAQGSTTDCSWSSVKSRKRDIRADIGDFTSSRVQIIRLRSPKSHWNNSSGVDHPRKCT